MKRLVSIQDMSCFGKCSQTVAIPIISSLGIETIPLPTAILSTHTGEFKDYTFLPLCNETKKIINHWKKLQLTFDAIYIGYIGSSSQVEDIISFIDYFADENTIVYLDPAMADDAKIYQGLDMEYVSAIKKLCASADIISPNIYEAMLLVDGECKKDYTNDDINRICASISALCKKTIITGVHKDKKIVSIGIDTVNNQIKEKENNKIDGMFYGAGDIFSSVFIGTYLSGNSFDDSISFADDFVQDCITKTLDEKEKYWYGLNFEKCIKKLSDFSK